MIYLITILLIFAYGLAFIFNKSHKNKKLFLFLGFLTLAVVLGLRGNRVGEDTLHYIDLYRIFGNYKWSRILSNGLSVPYGIYNDDVEIMFVILIKCLYTISHDGQFFIFCVSLLTCSLFARFIYKNINDHVFFATFVFVTNSLYMSCFNGIRQMLALSIAIFSYNYILERKWKKYIIITVVGFLIHNSSIVLSLFMLLLLIQDRRKAIKIVAISCLASSALMSIFVKIVTLILPGYSYYFNVQFWTNSYNGEKIIWIIQIAISLYIYFKKKKEIDIRNYFGIIGAEAYITCCILSLEVFAFSRLTPYFAFANLLLLPAFSDRIKRNKYVYIALIGFVLLAQFYSYCNAPSRIYEFFWN